VKRVVAALTLTAVTVSAAACGSDDDDMEPPSDSLLAEVAEGLCASDASTVAVGSNVYSLNDCP
jgi:hypothetical protein